MKTRRGKLVGLGSVGLGIVLLSVAGFSSRRLLLEQWHLPGLRSYDEETRRKAAEALGEYGSVRSIPPLMKANSDRLRFVLERQPARSDVLPHLEGVLVRLLGRRTELARQMSVTSAQRQMTFLSNQQAVLNARLAAVSRDMATVLTIDPYFESLTRIVEREKKAAVPQLLQELENDNWHVRWLAIRLLGSLGPDTEGAVPVLKTKTEDPNSFVRYAALRVLRALRNAGNPERGGAEQRT